MEITCLPGLAKILSFLGKHWQDYSPIQQELHGSYFFKVCFYYKICQKTQNQANKRIGIVKI